MNWKLFFTIYGLIFAAELPDKTAFASLLMASRNSPLAVFLGAALAFVIQSLVAVSFGSLLTLLPERWTHAGAGILFLVFAYLMWRETRESEAEETAKAIVPLTFGKAFLAAFLVIFVAEWGDLTQLATAALQAKYNAIWTVFTASTLALWTVTLIGVLVGHTLKNVLRPRFLQMIAAIVFAGVAVYFLTIGL